MVGWWCTTGTNIFDIEKLLVKSFHHVTKVYVAPGPVLSRLGRCRTINSKMILSNDNINHAALQ